MKFKHILLFTVTVAFLSACVDPSLKPLNLKPAKPFEIEFVVVGGGTKLKIVTPDKGCSNNKNGCIKVPSPNSGEITFKFQNVQKLPCAHPLKGWYLSKIELANIPGNFGHAVNDWVVDDFGAAKSSGLVWDSAGNKETVSVKLTDKNLHSGIVFYQVTAESCDPAKDPINSDPRIINGGTQ